MLNSVDLIIGAGVLIFFFLGFRAGFLRTLVSALWVYFCIYTASAIAPAMIKAVAFLSVEESQIGRAVLVLAIFIIIYLLGELVLSILKNLVSISILGPADKMLGGILGGVKGVLIAGIVFETILLMPLDKAASDTINASRLRYLGEQLFKRTYPAVLTVTPQIKEFVGRKILPVLPAIQASNSLVSLEVITEQATKAAESLKRFTP